MDMRKAAGLLFAVTFPGLCSWGAPAGAERPQAPPIRTSPKAAGVVKPPDLPRNSVGRPEFVLRKTGALRAGTAFVGSLDGQPMLLSALHLLGTAGGLERQVPAADVPRTVEAVHLFDMAYGAKRASAAGALLSKGTPIADTGVDCRGDLVAFSLDSSGRIPALPLAKSSPVRGERVWIAGAPPRSKQADAELIAGVAVDVTPETTMVRMDDVVDFTAYSGAPALNRAGEVVGVMISMGDDKGKVYAFLNPIEAVRALLATRKAQP